MLREDDALEMASNVHRLLLENDRVRILDVLVKPNEVAKMHWHPDNVSYVLGGGKLRISKPDKTVNEVDLKVGQTLQAKAGSHEVENIGDTIVHTIQVELKG